MRNYGTYEESELLKLLGKQRTSMFSRESCKEIDELVAARQDYSRKVLANDVFALGYIYGKRAERNRKKARECKEKLENVVEIVEGYKSLTDSQRQQIRSKAPKSTLKLLDVIEKYYLKDEKEK